MQTEILQEFIAVARHASISRAAEEVHLTQPALSKHIAALEREVGFKLFDRGPTTRLTPAGEYFYGHAQHMLDELDASIKEGQRIATQAQPAQLQMLGQGDSSINRFLASVKTPFQIVEMSKERRMFGMLEDRKADLLVAPGLPTILASDADLDEKAYGCLLIGKSQLSYLASRDNEKLAGKDSLDIEDLLDAEILLPFGSLYDYMAFTAVSYYGEELRFNFVEDPSLPTDSDDIPLVGLGGRIMLKYRGEAHHCCQNRNDIVAIDKFEGEPYDAEEYLAWRLDNPNPNVAAFAEEVRALVESEREDAGRAREPQGDA